MEPTWIQNGTKMIPNWTQNGTKMEEFLKPNPPTMKTKSNEAWTKTSVIFVHASQREPKWSQHEPEMEPKRKNF